MNFQIINNQGVFELHGQLVNEYSEEAFECLNTLLDSYYEIVICLKSLTKIDESGLALMHFVSEKAQKRSKTLFVLGIQNKRILKKFKSANLKSIFKSEYYH